MPSKESVTPTEIMEVCTFVHPFFHPLPFTLLPSLPFYPPYIPSLLPSLHTFPSTLLTSLPFYPPYIPSLLPSLHPFPSTLLTSLRFYPPYIPSLLPSLHPFPSTLLTSLPFYPPYIPSLLPSLHPFPSTLLTSLPFYPPYVLSLPHILLSECLILPPTHPFHLFPSTSLHSFPFFWNIESSLLPIHSIFSSTTERQRRRGEQVELQLQKDGCHLRKELTLQRRVQQQKWFERKA